MKRSLVGMFLFLGAFSVSRATIIAKSSKEECIIENDVKNKNRTTCRSKLVVSLTVNANEVCSVSFGSLWQLLQLTLSAGKITVHTGKHFKSDRHHQEKVKECRTEESAENSNHQIPNLDKLQTVSSWGELLSLVLQS